MSKPKKIVVRYIESSAQKKVTSKQDDDAQALQQKLQATDGEGCAFC